MVELLVVLALVLFNGFFALSEMAVMTSRRQRLKQLARDSKRAQAALELSEHPERFLSAVQVWITLLGILTGYFGGESVAAYFLPFVAQLPMVGPYAPKIALALSLTLILFVSVVLGELVPKRLGSLRPEKIATAVALPMRILAAVARPAVALLAASTRGLLRLMGFGQHSEEKVTQEEIRHLVAESHEQGVIAEDERNILNRVLRLSDRTAASLMTPRTRIVWLDTEAEPAENLEILRSHPFARYPVYRGSDQDVAGILEVKTLAASLGADGPVELFGQLRDALFVAASTHALKLLEIFREEQQTLALVVDEYGEIQGVVSISDLLGAVLGRIQDAESEDDGPLVVERSDGSWLIDGRLSTEELRELLGVQSLPGEEEHDFHTIAGMVIARFGRIPAVGEALAWDRWRIEVVDLDGARVDKLLVARTDPEDGG
jgi:putative hemolysin